LTGRAVAIRLITEHTLTDVTPARLKAFRKSTQALVRSAFVKSYKTALFENPPLPTIRWRRQPGFRQQGKGVQYSATFLL
jgi:hypothetical protein